ncbi:hypothetical protein NXS19_000938 [Fusarium pseudograminearum]|nr:hypothetical protein NXS19_000938 [Fusarium pseudograminearum]
MCLYSYFIEKSCGKFLGRVQIPTECHSEGWGLRRCFLEGYGELAADPRLSPYIDAMHLVGELSIICKHLYIQSDPPNSTYSEYTASARRGWIRELTSAILAGSEERKRAAHSDSVLLCPSVMVGIKQLRFLYDWLLADFVFTKKNSAQNI